MEEGGGETYDLTPIKNSDLPMIWVIGGPGSGKGTQCAKIVEKYEFTHLSTGDLLRHEVESGSDRGRQIDNIMKAGRLVPLETVLNLLIEAMLSCVETSKGFLIDGYPREVDQGTKFEKRIVPADLILYFETSDATMMNRLLSRAETSGRSDDNEETIKKRIETFHKNNEPILKKFAEKIKTISAEGEVDDIFPEVEKYIDELLEVKKREKEEKEGGGGGGEQQAGEET